MPLLREANLAPVRNEVVRDFISRFNWTPHWFAEVTLAVEGLENRLVVAERHAGSVALRSQLARAHRYRVEAFQDVTELERALKGQNRFQPVDAEIIMEDTVVEGAIARHLLFSKAFQRDKYPVHTGTGYFRALRPHTLALRHKDPEVQVSDWHDAYLSSSERHNFWLTNTRNAWLDPRVQTALQTADNVSANI
jgi:hypothetical protein